MLFSSQRSSFSILVVESHGNLCYKCEYPHFTDKISEVQTRLSNLSKEMKLFSDGACTVVICPGYKILALLILPHCHHGYQGWEVMGVGRDQP